MRRTTGAADPRNLRQSRQAAPGPVDAAHPKGQPMDRLFALSLGFAGLILATHAGHGQTMPNQCGPRADVLAVLANKFSETRRGLGLAGPSSVVELFASTTTGTWTVTVTLPDGRTCLLVSGEGWEAVPVELPAKGSPA